MYIDSGNMILLSHEKPIDVEKPIDDKEKDKEIPKDKIATETVATETVATEIPDEGLIGAFKLSPADQATERLSRRRRVFDDGEEVINPFMRSMPY